MYPLPYGHRPDSPDPNRPRDESQWPAAHHGRRFRLDGLRHVPMPGELKMSAIAATIWVEASLSSLAWPHS